MRLRFDDALRIDPDPDEAYADPTLAYHLLFDVDVLRERVTVHRVFVESRFQAPAWYQAEHKGRRTQWHHSPQAALDELAAWLELDHCYSEAQMSWAVG